MLNLPKVGMPVLYDCKAANNGYDMTYRDLTGFVDYLRHPHGGTREASFQRRHRALDQKVPGAKLTWMRAPDLVRFGLAIEAAEVAPAHREGISWASLLDAGDVLWDIFQVELRRLAKLGYTFPEAS
jgi:hypothetical protein